MRGGTDDLLFSEPLAGTSLSATLSLLRRGGNLKSDKTSERYVGRAKDKKSTIQGDSINQPGDLVIYEHRDAEGNLQTPKEAWRQLNYRFHGIAPGRKAMEKRIKYKELNVRVANTTGNVDTPMGTLGKLQKKLAHSQTPFMKLDM